MLNGLITSTIYADFAFYNCVCRFSPHLFARLASSRFAPSLLVELDVSLSLHGLMDLWLSNGVLITLSDRNHYISSGAGDQLSSL